MKILRIGLFVLLTQLLLFRGTMADETELHVVASIKPVHSILAGLMQGIEAPQLLVQGDDLPYGYVLDDEKKQWLKDADLIVWVGPELEHFLIQPLQQATAGQRVLTLLDSQELKILPSRWDDQQRDPYFWLDSRNALILLDMLTKELMAIDPARAHLYRRNRDRMFAKIAELDRRFEYGYRGLKGGLALSYYDTQQYFEQAYALKIAGVLSPSPEQRVAAQKLLQERQKIAEGWYACLLTESGMAMPELPMLLGDNHINQVELDSFGGEFPAGENLYLQLMNHNTRLIKKCMQVAAKAHEQQPSPAVEAVPALGNNIGGRFMLTDHRGRVVTEKDMLGKYQLLYFGYTYCPDVCPTSLQVIMAALKRLGKKAEKIQPYFITVDPERDTQDIMAGYVGYFGKNLIGLRGSPAMTQRVIKEYKLTVEKVLEQGQDPDKYLLDHTASVFLIGPDGRFISKFAHGITPSQLADKLNAYVH